MKVSVSAVITLCLSSSAAAFMLPSSSRQMSLSVSAATLEKSDATDQKDSPDVADDSETRAKFEKLLTNESEKEDEEQKVIAKVEVDPAMDPKKRIQVGRYNEKENSIAIPFLKRPSKLDGTHAGDFGFDPMGLSESYDLYTMQEAELRHARLAMLAVIGWPMSELLAPKWMLAHDGCAPSVLNGFGPVSFLATALIFGAAGYFEFKTSLRRTCDTEFGKIHREDMANVWNLGVAGDYNFDPLGLYSSIGDDASARKGLREVEISHGRSAMLGITAFAMWEYLTGHPIVENSMFFHPNLLLPSLVAAGVAAGQIYEFSDLDQYPLRLQVSSEGEARLNSLKRNMASIQEQSQEALIKADIGTKVEKTVSALKSLKEKYDNLNESYTANVMKNYSDIATKKE